MATRLYKVSIPKVFGIERKAWSKYLAFACIVSSLGELPRIPAGNPRDRRHADGRADRQNTEVQGVPRQRHRRRKGHGRGEENRGNPRAGEGLRLHQRVWFFSFL